MGVFDEVFIPCPDCGKEIYAQSKGARAPYLNKFYVNVPSRDGVVAGFRAIESSDPEGEAEKEGLRALAGLLGEGIECEHCGGMFSLSVEYRLVREGAE